MTLDDQIRAVEREINYRQWVYPRWVEKGRMRQEKADHEVAAMAAVLETLVRLKDS